jgi:hypothetical protein
LKRCVWLTLAFPSQFGPYPPSPRLLEGILVRLVWVYLYV